MTSASDLSLRTSALYVYVAFVDSTAIQNLLSA
jgi:hypothetical protein